MPKIFRIKKGGKVNRAIFEGSTINTPSMLCVEDYLDVLNWAGDIGLEGLIERSFSNLRVIEEWVEKTSWIDFLAESKEIRSNTSVCLAVTDEKFKSLSTAEQSALVKNITGKMSKENAAHDVNSYRDAPPGFRFWCGPTVESSDIKTAIEALEKAYLEEIAKL
jgi:phosphoserine aminotransferase